MNINSDDRFHELVHKALAKEASPAAQKELRALIAENPNLKEELEQMRAEVAVAREILPLLEDVQHPPGRTPTAPMERLRKEIAAVFEGNSGWKVEVQGLLGKLEDWAGRMMGAEREQLMAAIAALRQTLSASGEAPVTEAAMLYESRAYARDESASMNEARTRLMAEKAVVEDRRAALENRLRRLTTEMATEGKRRSELEDRLRHLESRIKEAEETAHECREEVRVLLDLLRRERESAGRQHG